MKKFSILVSICIAPFLHANDTQLNYAIDLMDHGLDEKATEAFISLFYQAKDQKIKAECLLNMGKISLKKGNVGIAVKDWSRLVNKYPNSSQSLEVKDQLTNIIQSSQDDSLNDIRSAVAINYLNNASFFSGSSEKWTLDTSYLPAENYAAYWCDRVIKEFPNTKAHEMALKKKFFAYFGWADRYSSFGLKYSTTYMPKLEQIITETETKFPSSGFLAAMCYQLGQYYWGKNDEENALKWWRKTQSVSSEGDYYFQLVSLRLLNWRERGRGI